MPWSGVGGVEIATLRMVEATRDRFRNVVFCLEDAAELADSFAKMGIEIVTYAPPEPSLRHGAKYYRQSCAVARLLRNSRADIVHFSDLKAAYHNSLAARLARTRTICHLRSTNSQLSRHERISLLPVHRFIFVSKEARRTFAVSLPDSKARVIYDAVEIPGVDIAESNTSVRHEFGIPKASAVIGMVARVAPVKDYFTLASAAAQVLAKHPDARFLIVGDNSMIDLNREHYVEVEKRLNELGIRDRFIFTGHRSDVPRLIAAMDISILCSHREGFGLCLVESMALRKPVVATAVGGVPEIVEHGVTGYLHQHGDSRELADAIVSLMEDPDRANRMGQAGLERVRSHFSRTAFVENISSAYLSAIGG